MKGLLVALSIALLSQIATAQFTIKLEISGSDEAAGKSVRDYFLKEFAALEDVTISDSAKFEVNAAVIKRKVTEGTYDYYLMIISTSNSFCVVGRDPGGRVTSSAECKELLTSNAYVGRENEVASIVSEFVKMLNLFVINPRRSLPQ